MELELRPLRKQDFDKVIQFAITGMHFDRYMSSNLLLKLYGRYFWYEELGRSSQVIAAYYSDELAGVLLADVKNEPKVYHSFRRNLYVRIFDFLQSVFYKKCVAPYDSANREILEEYSREHALDGEICFLAANPSIKVKGIGTMLLSELEKREHGKKIYLFTDNNCTYQFYEHKGFARVREKQISLEFSDLGTVPLSCYLYSKTCE